MNIEELGQEYKANADLIMEKLKFLRERAKDLPPEKHRKMNKRIRSLFESAIECKSTADRLINYHKKGEHK